MTKNTIWLRHEFRATERRTPLLPGGAKALINLGYDVVVERSDKRIIKDHAFSNAGCRMVEAGSWVKAPDNAVILGLKELPAKPERLKNTHVYFAHAYKEQSGWQDLLARFTTGGGDLLDIEYMVKDGKRVVAFGFWAGYMGAALALIHWNNQQSGGVRYLNNSLHPFDNATILDETIQKSTVSEKKPRVLIIGAGGRCGKGAKEILTQHGAKITCWGRQKTNRIDRAALLDHDILINCAFIMDDVPAFLRRKDLTEKARLSVVADISCDPFSAFNPIPLYHETTSWDKPYITVDGPSGRKTVDIIAIDNLPSLLPQEASIEFSDLLLPHLMTLKKRDDDPIWASARNSFDKAVCLMNAEYGKIHAVK
ncbi:Saccharopine dehydrogenase [NAD+, L-lysine-forming] [hydrothermal vent metagenome]|uniref:Saccharopine dehydrogenase [NAD(+), L-lysine-forming] n=1 Tax=hydrothermal vent metagenome TaxID=652676 RepID=A0A3B0S472_9ZZZZ